MRSRRPCEGSSGARRARRDRDAFLVARISGSLRRGRHGRALSAGRGSARVRGAGLARGRSQLAAFRDAGGSSALPSRRRPHVVQGNSSCSRMRSPWIGTSCCSDAAQRRVALRPHRSARLRASRGEAGIARLRDRSGTLATSAARRRTTRSRHESAFRCDHEHASTPAVDRANTSRTISSAKVRPLRKLNIRLASRPRAQRTAMSTALRDGIRRALSPEAASPEERTKTRCLEDFSLTAESSCRRLTRVELVLEPGRIALKNAFLLRLPMMASGSTDSTGPEICASSRPVAALVSSIFATRRPDARDPMENLSCGPAAS